MKTREILRQLRDDGWFQVRQTGSHAHFKHPTKPGIVTVALHGMNDDLKRGRKTVFSSKLG